MVDFLSRITYRTTFTAIKSRMSRRDGWFVTGLDGFGIGHYNIGFVIAVLLFLVVVHDDRMEWNGDKIEFNNY